MLAGLEVDKYCLETLRQSGERLVEQSRIYEDVVMIAQQMLGDFAVISPTGSIIFISRNLAKRLGQPRSYFCNMPWSVLTQPGCDSKLVKLLSTPGEMTLAGESVLTVKMGDNIFWFSKVSDDGRTD